MGNDFNEDLEQIEWCRQWEENQSRKHARRRHWFRSVLALLLAAVVDKEGKDDDEGGRG